MPTRRSLLLAPALLALTLAPAGASQMLEIGKPAPLFEAVDSHGKTVRLADLRGRVVVLEWTNHDCPFVRKHYNAKNMQAQQRDATEDGVVWLTILSSAPGEQGHVAPAEANRLTETRGAAPSNVLLDPTGKIGLAYGAQVTPHMYVVGKDGTLLYRGGIDDKPTTRVADVAGATQHVRKALEAIKASRPVDPAITRAYGCTIKYAT
jgi:peroxiredoxin